MAAGIAAAAAVVGPSITPKFISLVAALGGDGAPAATTPAPSELPGHNSPPGADGGDDGGTWPRSPGPGDYPFPRPDLEQTPEEAREALEDLGIYELGMQLEEARRNGDVAEFERLSELFLDGIADMDQAEAHAYLEEMGMKSALMVVALSDGDLHPGIVQWLSDASVFIDNTATYRYSPFELELLEGILGPDVYDLDNEQVTAALETHVIDQALAQPGAAEAFYDVIKSGETFGEPADAIGQAVHQYLLDNPDQLAADVREAQHGDATSLQNLLEAVGTTVDEDAMNALIDNYIATQAQGLDPSDLDSFAWDIGQLQFQLSEVGSDASYDPTAVLLFLAKELPKPISTSVKGVEAAIKGYTADTTYQNLSRENRENRDFLLLAMATAVAADPSLAPELEAVFNGPGDDPVGDWVREGGDTYDIVNEIAFNIELGNDNNRI